VSEQSSELQTEITHLERDITRIMELNHENEFGVGQCHVSGYNKLHVSSLWYRYM